ncbi:hypothetical protein [Trichlorobacter lovleyi]|uniref:hypothetical protein n=1 Tax=Trichlorobacter lovleyi TaxID=313985 RepID=UPI002FDEAB8F
MKTKILAAIITLITAATAHAGSWSVKCTNGSCETNQGSVVIHYSAADMRGYRVDRVNGVTGLPFNAEDFQAQERALNISIDKSLSRDRRSGSGMDASGSVGEGITGGGKINNDNSSSVSLTRKKSMSVSQSAGGRVTVNHTLGFFLHYAATNTMCSMFDASNTNRYYCAAENIMNSYAQDGGETIKMAMYDYLFSLKSADIMPDVDMTAKTTADNSEMQATKFIALTQFPLAGDERWSVAHQNYNRISRSDESFGNLNKLFEKYKKSVQTLMKPGQTALKLEKSGEHDLAIAKYAADCKIDWKQPGLTNIKTLADRYTVAIAAAQDSDDLKRDYQTALSKHSNDLEIVTVPVNYVKIVAQVVKFIGIAAVFGAGAWFCMQFWKKRSKKPVSVDDETE